MGTACRRVGGKSIRGREEREEQEKWEEREEREERGGMHGRAKRDTNKIQIKYK